MFTALIGFCRVFVYYSVQWENMPNLLKFSLTFGNCCLIHNPRFHGLFSKYLMHWGLKLSLKCEFKSAFAPMCQSSYCKTQKLGMP